MTMQKMKIGVLGSGVVGKTLASGFLAKGHETMVGTDHAEKLADWLKENAGAKTGDFEKTAGFGELVILAVRGTEVESAIVSARPENFAGKVVIDVTNPLVFKEDGQPPRLSLGFPHSNGEKLQTLLPEAEVVKAFNTMAASYMTNATLREGTPDMFIAGNNDGAKKIVADIASGWGWPVTDIGEISQAYLLEALAMLWVRYAFLNNHWTHAFKLLKK